MTQTAAIMEAKPMKKPTNSHILAILAPDSDELCSSEIYKQNRGYESLGYTQKVLCIYMLPFDNIHHAKADGAENSYEDVSCGNLVLPVDRHCIN